METVLMKGNEALAEAAIRAGLKVYFGYPITPQNEVGEYLAKNLPQAGGIFLQAESEVAAINMVYGAAGAGVRTMTSSSGPGISLMQEGISYIAGAELPAVIVNMMRGGPGLGGIQPSQSDYFQATKGGGHGDYRLIVLAPSSVQELYDHTMLAFDLADYYRNPVMILGDGLLGQMMESVTLKPYVPAYPIPEKNWATRGRKGRTPNIINSLYLDPEKLYLHNQKLFTKYREIEEKEVRVEIINESAEFFFVAYGSSARISLKVIEFLKEKGINAGLIRPITLWPFPSATIREKVLKSQGFMVIEMSMGQMVEDVERAVMGQKPVYFYGTAGGIVPSPQKILAKTLEIFEGREK
ncbi:3-methyl-2-oxobutanoate dehydrogenase subunit VorB [Carboxydothermus pertinax]|uniref:3-methyl-2-oxobutanoate dehydrogenase subunit VorB n=1 Tax=Carboxydothermus pertinax TaxID=870242 RepID=A0A1L8CTS1_9THEO|nr:3-methyl-2-oxobutanoate dehydrogenase subunit VorB [Carboxydothermus pertinax]GAV22229.1 3-methyl-2-oxobutanoate dehydrogenase subunit VorB [Carboxydothermus pertinax]